LFIGASLIQVTTTMLGRIIEVKYQYNKFLVDSW
jgi:hypothetical protein